MSECKQTVPSCLSDLPLTAAELDSFEAIKLCQCVMCPKSKFKITVKNMAQMHNDSCLKNADCFWKDACLIFGEGVFFGCSMNECYWKQIKCEIF